MNRVSSSLAGLVFFASSASAQSLEEQRQLEEIRSSVQTENTSLNRMLMWQRLQNQNLGKSMLADRLPPLTPTEVLASERSERCFPWGFEGGQRNRVAVAVAAELCLKATLDAGIPLERMKSEILAQAAVDAYIFNQQVQVASTDARATTPMLGDPSATAAVTVLGNQVWSDSVRAPNLSWGQTMELVNFDKSFSQTFLVGPVPANVTVGVRGSTKARFEARLAIGNARASAVPVVDSVGYAFGGLDAAIVKGGVEGSIGLVHDTLTLEGKVGLVIDPTTEPVRLVYAAEALGHNKISALEGAVDLVAETKFAIPGLGKTFRYPIFSGTGMSAEGYIFHERVEPTPVRF